MATPQIPKVRYLSEIFEDANKSSDPVASLKDACQREVRLATIIGYSVNPKWKISLILPEGSPPFKESDLPLGLAGLDILKIASNLYVLFNKNMKQFQKETQFIKWLEAMHPIDSKLLCQIKDQKLEESYPKLTKKVLYSSLGWSDEDYKSSF